MLFFIIAFWLGSPFALLDFPTFVKDLLYELRHLDQGNGIILGKGWWYHLRVSLFFGLGWSLFFLSLAGIFVFIKKDRKKAVIFLSFPLIYYFLAGKGYTVFLRYVIPVIPFLCVTGAIALVALSNFLSIKNKTLNILAFLILLPAIYNIIYLDWFLTKKDSRVLAAEWIKKNMADNSLIYQTGNEFAQIQPWSLWKYDEKINKFRIKRIRKLKGEGEETELLPRYIVLIESPLLVYTAIPEEILKITQTSYLFRKSFVAMDAYGKDNLYDLQDTFFIPFTGFRKIQMPGPNIYIYEKK
jgi:hypothetical protein